VVEAVVAVAGVATALLLLLGGGGAACAGRSKELRMAPTVEAPAKFSALTPLDSGEDLSGRFGGGPTLRNFTSPG